MQNIPSLSALAFAAEGLLDNDDHGQRLSKLTGPRIDSEHIVFAATYAGREAERSLKQLNAPATPPILPEKIASN